MIFPKGHVANTQVERWPALGLYRVWLEQGRLVIRLG